MTIYNDCRNKAWHNRNIGVLYDYSTYAEFALQLGQYDEWCHDNLKCAVSAKGVLVWKCSDIWFS